MAAYAAGVAARNAPEVVSTVKGPIRTVTLPEDGMVIYTFPIPPIAVIARTHRIISHFHATGAVALVRLVYDVNLVTAFDHNGSIMRRKDIAPIHMMAGYSFECCFDVGDDLPCAVAPGSTLSVYTRQDGRHAYPRVIEA